MTRLRLLGAAALVCAVSVAAGPARAADWDVSDPGGPRQTLAFETGAATWMSVDVHPDGGRLVFDLLGDLWVVPLAGGEARLLSGGIPWDIQPRWSPDGARILFTSDRGGGDNLWSMLADGTDARPVTKESFRLLNSGTWHPSGEWVVGKKHFTSGRSMGAGELWMYRMPRGGDGVRLTERKNDQMDVGEPCFSPDGRFIYWSEDMSPGKSFTYNKDPNRRIYMIRRLDLDNGEITNLVDVPGGAVRPQCSPDGKTLAFVRRVDTRSVLCLFDFETGEIRPLWDGLDEDQQETWALFGVYPGFDWTPNGRALVLWAKGGLWRVDVRSGEPLEIPFTCRVELSVREALRFEPQIAGETFPVKVIRWAQPLGREDFLFQALGTLWSRRPGDAPKMLFPATSAFRFAPELSPDGKRVVYVTWSDRAGGTVRSSGTNGRGERTVIGRPGHWANASWSPDGEWIVAERGAGDRYRGRLWDEDRGIWITASDGREEPRLVSRDGRRPRFTAGGERILLIGRDGDENILYSVDRLGSDRRVHVQSEHAGDFVVSPDGRWLAFEELWHTYVCPFPRQPGVLEVGPKTKSVPVRRLSRHGGTDLAWSRDSRTVYWSLGPEIFSADVDSVFVAAAAEPEDDSGESDRDGGDADESDAKKDPVGIADPFAHLGWEEPADIPPTDLWITGATVLPMNDLSRIENGVVHIEGDRITGVGTADELAPPPGARTLDARGMTLLPGFVDVHAHTGSSNHRVYAQQNWAFLANLAFGVTTTHDPSNNTQMIFAQSELVRQGQLLGPRIFSTGTVLYGAEGDFKTVIGSYEDAESAIERTAAWGAFSVKSYNQPRREQRQMVIRAAAERNVMVVPEGGSVFQYNLTHIVDGHTTLEHAIPVAPLYDAELRLLAESGTAYTPTLGVGYGGLWGENWWYMTDDVWENERLMTFVPRSVVVPRSRRRMKAPQEEFHHFALARTVTDVMRRGGNVEVGAHGQMQGLAVHWEMWMFEQGGMTPHEALRAGTWMGARALGLDGQLGSIRSGLLADLILVEGDPTEDLRRSEDIAHVMINGRLFDARTLGQLEPARRDLPPGPFLDEVVVPLGTGCLEP